jgi:phosphoserine phosphatase
MVTGCSTSNRALVILDLDGTILSINSFRHWALFLMRGQFPHLGPARRLRIALSAIAAMTLRKTGLMDHWTLKRRLQCLWQDATAGDGGASARRLVQHLKAFVRPELSSVLKDIAAGKYDAIMATAAAADYAEALGKTLGFQHVLATPAQRTGDMPDNIGEQKRLSVLDAIRRQGWTDRPRVLFTDHRDDLPLCGVCQTVYWFGSADEMAEAVRATPGVHFQDGFSQPFRAEYELH